MDGEVLIVPPPTPPTPQTYIVPPDMAPPLAIAALPLFVVASILALGLGVVLIAMRSPRAGRQRESESKAADRLLTAALVVVCAFGLVVPALVLAFNGEHKASVAIGGVHLNGEQQKGRELFAHACTVCHTLAAVKSVGRT